MGAFDDVLADDKLIEEFAKLPPQDQAAFNWRMGWMQKAHKHQIEPPGDWWNIWLMLAGRGAGKTRAAAETLASWAYEQPNTRWLVSAPTSGDIRGTCFEGDSGLMSVIPEQLIGDYNKSLHEIKLINGSFIKGIPASEPERFRGGQWHGAWCLVAGTKITMADGSTKDVESITPGDVVSTRFGPRKVTHAGKSNNPNGVVSIDVGYTRLTLTEDHPILIGDRWIPAGKIKKGDRLWAQSSMTECLGTSHPQGITGTSIGDGYTGTSGLSSMGQYRKDGLFTTLTRILRTTTSAIFRQCHLGITCGSMQRTALPQKSKNKQHHDPSRKEGLRLIAFVSSVEQVLQRLLLVGKPQECFAGLNAKIDSGLAQDSSQKSGTVADVAPNTRRLNHSRSIAASNAITNQQSEPIGITQLAVRSVERYPNCETFNLTVDDVHEYFANGIVVHNCDELAAWDYLQESWDMIQFAVRLGSKTKIIASTTPKPKPLVMELLGREGDDVVVTKASTYVNVSNLAPSFQKQILQYEGTNLGRQEIHAEIIDPEEGGIVKREWFRLWPSHKSFPKLEYILQSYDCATSDKTYNDPSGCITFGVFKPMDGGMSVMVLDCWNEHLQYPDLRPKVIAEYETVYGEGKNRKLVDTVLVEDKSAGISLIQDLQRAHIPVHAYNPGRADKVQRLSIVANIIKAGRVWVPESGNRKGFVRDWAEGMVSQICSFPEGTVHDEYVDCMSQGLRYLRDAGWISIDAPPREEIEQEDITDAEIFNMKGRENPYSA